MRNPSLLLVQRKLMILLLLQPVYRKRLWGALGFTYKLRPTTPEMPEHELVIPPDPTPEVRARLLRAWVELHAWLANYKRRTSASGAWFS